MKYLIGQKVVLNKVEIGTIVKPERDDMPNNDDSVWVHSPTRGYPSYYSIHNVKPLALVAV
jgi:hypothetical protein